MDLYHNWLYVHVINTKWMVWSIVVIVLGANILAPVFIWLTMSGRKVKFSFARKVKVKN